jgi:hypothetical protein
MAHTLDNPDERRREAGIERARAFSWRRTAQLTVAAYEAAMDRELVRPALEEDSNSRQDQDLEVQR